MLYSDDLERFNDDIPKSIEFAIAEIKQVLEIHEDIPVFKFDKYRIAVSLTLKINLPSKGTFNQIDIRQLESILMVFSLKNYPTTAPVIKSNRKDFPVSELSHLYVVKNNIAPSLCLVRGNLNEWFANRRIPDLITVTRQWFAKAASGDLTEDGEEFDPVRLEGYSGYMIYKYSKLVDIISNDFSFLPNQKFALNLLATSEDRIYTSEGDLSYLYLVSIPFTKTEEAKDLILKNDQSDPNKKIAQKLLFGLLFWAEDVTANYDVNFPTNYEELCSFCDKCDINIKEAISLYITNNYDILVGIPIIIAIKRPAKLIGYSAEYEFFHFVISAGKDKTVNNKVKKDAKVKYLSHREPLSSELARKISGSQNEKKTMFIGAGSLGSKIIMHYARGGNYNLTIIDNDKFSPHNLVRHELFMDSAGAYKSTALSKKIKDFLIVDSKSSIKSIESSIFQLNQNDYSENDWLVDTTASLNVQNWLCNGNLLNINNRARAELAYMGRLGFLYIEGNDHNPRIDDLINYIYFLALEIKVLSAWLNEELLKKEGKDYDIIDVGLGCNSATVLMGNDAISFHASIMSKILNNECERSVIKNKGLINLSVLSDDGYNVFTENYIINPLLSFKCQNNSEWEIRMLPVVLNKLKKVARKFGKNETGGVFIGISNYKTKTIHVFDTILAPRDSKHGPTYFYRGINNLPEQVDYIQNITGGMIGYIGEWHTHPMGLDSLSPIDLAAVKKLKPLNDRVPIPTFISVLSKNKYLPFIFV